MIKEASTKELESLIRTLEFIQEEQAFIKNKIAGILTDKVVESTIEWVEELNQHISNRESAIQLLKNDILSLSRLLKIKVPNSTDIDVKIITTLKKYKQQIVYLENEFMKWKHDVNQKIEFPGPS
jgi:predicted RNase H-like nuclease (RuvC/YqgF family)